MTVGVDVVLELDRAHLDPFLDQIKPWVEMYPYSAHASMKSHSMFQGLDTITMFKFDFHVGERIPGELNRTVVRELFEGITVPVVSPEDAVLSKVIWYQMGSGKSRQDA